MYTQKYILVYRKAFKTVMNVMIKQGTNFKIVLGTGVVAQCTNHYLGFRYH